MSDLFEDRKGKGEFTCPWCGDKNDSTIDLAAEPRVFKDGDVGICFGCSRPSIYQTIGLPRKPTEAEWAKVNQDPDITKVRKACFMANHGNVRYDDLGTEVIDDEGS